MSCHFARVSSLSISFISVFLRHNILHLSSTLADNLHCEKDVDVTKKVKMCQLSKLFEWLLWGKGLGVIIYPTLKSQTPINHHFDFCLY